MRSIPAPEPELMEPALLTKLAQQRWVYALLGFVFCGLLLVLYFRLEADPPAADDNIKMESPAPKPSEKTVEKETPGATAVVEKKKTPAVPIQMEYTLRIPETTKRKSVEESVVPMPALPKQNPPTIPNPVPEPPAAPKHPPTIGSFSASQPSMRFHETITLSWTIQDAEEVKLQISSQPAGSRVTIPSVAYPAKGSFELKIDPATFLRYGKYEITISATGPAGVASKSLNLELVR